MEKRKSQKRWKEVAKFHLLEKTRPLQSRMHSNRCWDWVPRDGPVDRQGWRRAQGTLHPIAELSAGYRFKEKRGVVAVSCVSTGDPIRLPWIVPIQCYTDALVKLKGLQKKTQTHDLGSELVGKKGINRIGQ